MEVEVKLVDITMVLVRVLSIKLLILHRLKNEVVQI